MGCQSNTNASTPQVCTSRPKLGILDLHVQLLPAASALYHLIHGGGPADSDNYHNTLPYICKSCPVIMPFDMILRVFHSPSASWHKMFQAHLFHLPQTRNQPFLQEVMNPSSGKQYLTWIVRLLIGMELSLFPPLVSI